MIDNAPPQPPEAESPYLHDDAGTGEVSRHEPPDGQGSRENYQHPGPPRQVPQPVRHAPSQGQGRPVPAPLPPPVRVGQDHGGHRSIPRLSIPHERMALPKLVQAIGPDMAAVAVASINVLGDVVEKATQDQNDILRFAAAKSIEQSTRKWSELSMGRTININTDVKSQRDLPRLDRLPPEDRAQLEALIEKMNQPDIEHE